LVVALVAAALAHLGHVPVDLAADRFMVDGLAAEGVDVEGSDASLRHALALGDAGAA
jgi:hypothetical protein